MSPGKRQPRVLVARRRHTIYFEDPNRTEVTRVIDLDNIVWLKPHPSADWMERRGNYAGTRAPNVARKWQGDVRFNLAWDVTEG